MEGRTPPSSPSSSGFRHFFVRGLAILLPTVLTIWILLAAYQFVAVRIAAPINQGVRQLVLRATPWPLVSDADLVDLRTEIERARDDRYQVYRAAANPDVFLRELARRQRLERWWAGHSIAMDLIGLILAIVLIYIVGVLLTSYIGRRLYHQGERILNRLPLIRRVYPSVKQITDFFVGDNQDRLKFSRVVAVEYPRKGIWSIGLVTGETMRDIQERAGEPCLTVFVPSSPTPFTGYVIVIPQADTIELPISVEDAMKFSVSGGVVIPPSQQIARVPPALAPTQNGPTTA